MSFQPLTLDQLEQLSSLLDKKAPLDEIGRLVLNEGNYSRFIHKVLGRNQRRIADIISRVNASFVHLEQKGVKIYDDQIKDPVYQEAKEKYRNRFKVYTRSFQSIDKWINSLSLTSSHLKEYHTLNSYFVGMQYQIGAAGGGWDPLPDYDREIYRKLKEEALKWKQSEPLAVNKTTINSLEKAQLKEAARYKEWTKLLENDEYQTEFFKWAILSWNPVDAFILCPHTQSSIHYALLYYNLGRARDCSPEELKGNMRKPDKEEVLAFKTIETSKPNVFKRVLTLPVYQGDYQQFDPDQQTRINILNPNEKVTFKQEEAEYTLTVQQIWDECSQKDIRESKINFFKWGFTNFHAVERFWDEKTCKYIKPPMTKDNWMDYVPFSDMLTDKEIAVMKKQYNIDPTAQKFYKVMANRQYADKRALECHGFWRFYIHVGEGKWKVIDTGLYAYRFKKGFFDSLKLFCATVKRVLSVFEMAGNMPRQKGGYAPPQNQEHAQKQSDRIYRYMTQNRAFQLPGKNCSRPIQRDAEKRIFIKEGEKVPNLFRQSMAEGKSGYFLLDAYLAFFARFGNYPRFQHFGIYAACKLFELFAESTSMEIDKGEKKVSYSTGCYFKKTLDLYNPALLLHNIIEDQKKGEGPFVNGELYWTVTDEKLLFLEDE
jgi:hypothetical protein